jgi:NTE family protein
LGLLSRINRFSSVSAGAIVAAKLGLEWSALEFDEGGVSRALGQKVIGPLLSLTARTLDITSIMFALISAGTAVDRVVREFESLLFGGGTLQDFPDAPRFVVNATNVQSGVQWRFSKPYMGDYRVGRIVNPTVPLANVVAASAALAAILSPVVFDFRGADWIEGYDLSTPEYRDHVALTDGSIYDPLALESAWNRYDTILISDANLPLQPESESSSNQVIHTGRLFSILDSSVRALRKRQVIESFQLGLRRGAYWGIATDIRHFQLSDAVDTPLEQITELVSIPTRYSAIPSEIQKRLINWGYAVCDASLRAHVLLTAAKPTTVPYPSGN